MLMALSLSLALVVDPLSPRHPTATDRTVPGPATAPACTAPGLSETAFDRLDRDGDGVLTLADTRRRWMGRDRGRRAGTDPVLQRLDRDGDGRVSRQEITRLAPACHRVVP